MCQRPPGRASACYYQSNVGDGRPDHEQTFLQTACGKMASLGFQKAALSGHWRVFVLVSSFYFIFVSGFMC